MLVKTPNPRSGRNRSLSPLRRSHASTSCPISFHACCQQFSRSVPIVTTLNALFRQGAPERCSAVRAANQAVGIGRMIHCEELGNCPIDIPKQQTIVYGFAILEQSSRAQGECLANLPGQILFKFGRRKRLPSLHWDDNIGSDESLPSGTTDPFNGLRTKRIEGTIDAKHRRKRVDRWAVYLVAVFFKDAVEVHLEVSDVAILRTTCLSADRDHGCASVLPNTRPSATRTGCIGQCGTWTSCKGRSGA